MKLRITVRGANIELRGYLDGDHETLNKIMADLDAFGREHDTLIIFSTAPDDYAPFAEPDPQSTIPGLARHFPKDPA